MGSTKVDVTFIPINLSFLLKRITILYSQLWWVSFNQFSNHPVDFN